jgi:hypothetical protein
LITSSRFGLPRRKLSVRAVSVKGNGSARRLGGGRHALRGLADVVQRAVLVAGGVLDRAAYEPHIRRKPNGLRHHRGRVAEALLEVGRDRQVSGLHDYARVGQRLVARHLAVTLAKNAGLGAA